MRRIIMHPAGKPSADPARRPRIYKNALGLDQFIVAETCAEVAACRKSGIDPHTSLLARDYDRSASCGRVAPTLLQGQGGFHHAVTRSASSPDDTMTRKPRHQRPTKYEGLKSGV